MPDPDPVRQQYEELPYPPRDPARELELLRVSVLGELGIVNHRLWAGARRLGPGLRLLDAGCGTGDTTVFMAEQVRGTGAEVVGLDVSEASLEVARQRLARRGLDGVRLVRGRIEEVDELDLGSFDYIVSAGVLHHLVSPDEGLAALRSVLAPDGGIGVMVYGKYGRAAVSQLQELPRILAPATLPTSERLSITRATLARLAPFHWARLPQDVWQEELSLHGDAGLFDLLLHATDRAYTAPEVQAWTRRAGLEIHTWLMPVLYDPASYGGKPEAFAHLSPDARIAVAELLNSRMTRHSFLACHAGAPAPEPVALDDERAIPAWLVRDTDRAIRDQVSQGRLTIHGDGVMLTQELDEFGRAFLTQVDGRKTLGAILSELAPLFPKESRGDLLARWRVMHDWLQLFIVLGLLPAAQVEEATPLA